jgi:hypothetical protein
VDLWLDPNGAVHLTESLPVGFANGTCGATAPIAPRAAAHLAGRRRQQAPTSDKAKQAVAPATPAAAATGAAGP